MSEPTKELIQQLTERWKGGERLPSLARDASTAVGKELACATVRNWIVKECGGKEKFAAASTLRDEAHPRTAGPGFTPVDDSDVPVIKSAKLKDGWKLEGVTVRGRREDVIISPDGKRYVHALPQERADLIAKIKTRGLEALRLRLESGSHVGRRKDKEEKVEQERHVAKKQRRVKKQQHRKTIESLTPEA
jgi:hypothetical protein